MAEPISIEEYRKKGNHYAVIEGGLKETLSSELSQQFLQDLVHHLSLEESMESLCTGIKELLNLDACCWMGSRGFYSEDKGSVLKLSDGLKHDLFSRVKRLDDYFFTFEALIKLGVLSRQMIQRLKKSKVESFFILPVSFDDDIQGMFMMLQSTEREWHSDDVALIKNMSGNVSAALRFGNERIQMKKALEQEQVLSRITSCMSQTFNVATILKTTAEEIGSYLKLDRCLLFQFDSSNEALPVQLLEQFVRPEMTAIASDDLPYELTYEGVGLFKEPLVKSNLASFNQKYGIQSALSLPIIYRGIPLGSLLLHQCDGERQWDLEEMEFLNSVVTHLGAAIFQSNLYHQEQKAKDLARTALLRKNQYLASMTHELRTPLHTIITCSSMGLDHMLGSMTEKQMEYVKLVNQSGDHLLSMIDDLLDLAKIEAGKLVLKPRRINLLSVLREVRDMMMPLFQKKEQEFQLLVSDDFPVTVQADALRLKQVLLNLLSNAHKFTPESHSIELICELKRDEIWIQVKDTGVGIPADELDKIFDPFEQASNKTASNTKKGTGLGLSIAKSITEMHGGRLEVSSVLGEGSVFKIVLPSIQSDLLLPNTMEKDSFLLNQRGEDLIA